MTKCSGRTISLRRSERLKRSDARRSITRQRKSHESCRCKLFLAVALAECALRSLSDLSPQTLEATRTIDGFICAALDQYQWKRKYLLETPEETRVYLFCFRLEQLGRHMPRMMQTVWPRSLSRPRAHLHARIASLSEQ